MIIKLYFLLFFIFHYSFNDCYSQNIRLIAGTVCSDGVVSVPVSVQNMENIYGFYMQLHYDQSIMTLTSYNILNPSLFASTIINDVITGTISIQMPLDTVAINMNGYMYVFNFSMSTLTNTQITWDTVFFADQGGGAVPVTLINGAIFTPPVLTQQPEDLSVCENSGQIATFSIQTADTNHLINWQVSYNGGLSWLTLVNDLNYQGVNSQTLSINAPVVQMNHNLYRCKLSGACQYISDIAELEVFANIILQPRDTVIDAGGTAVFTTEGSGSTPTYLWEVSTDNGITWSSTQPFPAVTTPSITIINPPLSWHGYKFRCIIQGICAPQSDTTDIATLWIGTAGMSDKNYLNIELFPNPAREYTNIILNSQFPMEAQYEIYNANGLKIISDNVYLFTGTNRINIKTDTWAPGIYFIKICFKNGDFKSLKFIK